MSPRFAQQPRRGFVGAPITAGGILGVVLLYASLATLWILFSDRLLGLLVSDHDTLLALSILKGFLYVIVTSLLLFLLLRRMLVSSTHCRQDMDGGHPGLVAWPRWSLYLVAIVLCVIMAFVRQELAVSLANRPLLIMMVLPIIIAAALGGFGPGLIATVLVAGAAAWFIPPDGSFAMAEIHDIVQWAILLCDGLLIVLVSAIMHHSRQLELERWRELLTAQESLRKSEEGYRRLHESMMDCFVQTSMTGEILFVNNAFLEMLGYGEEELRGKRFQELTPAKWHVLEEKIIAAEILPRGYSDVYEKEYIKKDGTVFPVEIRSFLLRNGAGQPEGMWAIVRDITTRKRADEERERLLAAIEQAGEMIMITDPAGTICYVNPAFARVTGYSREETIGKTPRILKSGEQDDQHYRTLWATITSGSSWEGRMVNRRKDGTLYTEEATISPVFDQTGRIVNYVSVKRDITEHLELTARFQQAQKMEAVGRLAGGVAHDYNNMLSVILGYTELALDRTEPSSPLHADLQEILQAAKRSADITRQLLAFARKQKAAPMVLDLNDAVQRMLKMLRRLIGEDITLIWQPAASVWPVRIDPAQLDQILANLCVNARDAIAGVGTVTIETENRTIDEAFCVQHPDFVAGEFVLLAVSDDGCGMDREILAHLFEPFFTTKGIGKGTGLGLSTIYGIVRQSGGFIDVYSEPGCGTTFRVYLPRQEENARMIEAVKGELPPPARGETVLLVEDEAAILNLGRTLLERLGYIVLSAATPQEAIRLAQEQVGAIDLLITDVIMPEMNGRDLADQLRMFCPGLRTLFMSGYTANVIAQQGGLEGDVHYLQKPFTMHDLAVQARKTLNGEW
ncbi:MAG: PAS domain S-box protein [Thermodesulfobacteriota bacterium]